MDSIEKGGTVTFPAINDQTREQVQLCVNYKITYEYLDLCCHMKEDLEGSKESQDG